MLREIYSKIGEVATNEKFFMKTNQELYQKSEKASTNVKRKRIVFYKQLEEPNHEQTRSLCFRRIKRMMDGWNPLVWKENCEISEENIEHRKVF